MRTLQLSVLTVLGLAIASPMAHAGNIVIYNTGVDVTGTKLGAGTTDSHYTLTANPAAGGTSTAYVDTKAYSGWTANTSTSQWINPLATDGGNNAQTVVNGTYDYVTTFSLAGYNPTTANITGSLAADDTVTDILINGFSTHATNNAAYTYGSFHNFTIGSPYSADFLAGTNTITFVVQNTANGPSGLQVQIAGTASTPTPEPAALLPLLGGTLGLLGLGLKARRQPASAA